MAFNIMLAGSRLHRAFLEYLRPHDLSFQQYMALRFLQMRNGAPASINDLREGMLDETSNVSRIVEKLRRKGLVERRENAEDRREVEISLTKSGKKLLRDLKKLDRIWKTLTEPVTENQALRTSRTLEKILNA